jgi:hypothetical protein
MRRWGRALALMLASTGCGDDAGGSGSGGEAPTTSAAASSGAGGDAQTPPRGEAEVEAWLAAGSYTSWRCESDVHAARSPSPHGFNRVCSNDLIASNASGDAPWPAGAAAVKELHGSADSTEPTGYAVYLKLAEDSAEGAGWYWYERIGTSVVADGTGDAGSARSICVGCHSGAGSDTAHTPSPGARDHVYTPIP